MLEKFRANVLKNYNNSHTQISTKSGQGIYTQTRQVVGNFLQAKRFIVKSSTTQ